MCALCLAALCSPSVIAADEELVLLTIQGDLLGKIESLQREDDGAFIIDAYYELLASDVRAEIEFQRLQLFALLADYEVAFAAADSSELMGIMEAFEQYWAVIRTIHAQQFTLEVVGWLNKAYGDVYPFIGLRK